MMRVWMKLQCTEQWKVCVCQVLEGLLEEDESCLEVWYLLALAQYAGGAPDVAKETLMTLDDLLAKPGAIAPTDDPPDLLDLKVIFVGLQRTDLLLVVLICTKPAKPASSLHAL